jgi:hypothetical protein
LLRARDVLEKEGGRTAWANDIRQQIAAFSLAPRSPRTVCASERPSHAALWLRPHAADRARAADAPSLAGMLAGRGRRGEGMKRQGYEVRLRDHGAAQSSRCSMPGTAATCCWTPPGQRRTTSCAMPKRCSPSSTAGPNDYNRQAPHSATRGRHALRRGYPAACVTAPSWPSTSPQPSARPSICTSSRTACLRRRSQCHQPRGLPGEMDVLLMMRRPPPRNAISRPLERHCVAQSRPRKNEIGVIPRHRLSFRVISLCCESTRALGRSGTTVRQSGSAREAEPQSRRS